MARLSFAEVKTAFEHDDVDDFKCIALPRGCTCANDLWPEQKEAAKRILRRDPTTLRLKDVRNVVNCLVCETHQSTYTWKNRVESEWKHEFPSLDFKSRRSPSPLSLCPSSAARRRRQSATPLSSRSQDTPPTTASSSSLPLASDSPRITLNERLHGRAASDSNVPTTPVLNEEGSPPLRSQIAAIQPESPLAGRGRSREVDQDAQILSPDYVRDGSRLPPDAVPSLSLDMDMEDVDPPVIGPQSTQLADGAEAIQDLSRFSPGDASTWAPWTLRSEVLGILLETLPESKTKGSIYAVRVHSTPYVKIGYTTKRVKDRLKEIERQHGEQLDINAAYKLSGIPLLQLMRLEALVHADLAYFQHNLRVPNGRSHRFHREYFRIDLAQAEKSVVFWWDVMKDIGLEPGRELDRELCETIKTNPALRIEISANQGVAAEAEHWHCLNSDHDCRKKIWDVVFRRDQGGFRKGHIGFGLIWPISGLLCFVLFRETARVEPLFVYVVAAALLLSMWRWR